MNLEQALVFNTEEYDFTSLGEKVHLKLNYENPHRIGFGREELRRLVSQKTREVVHELSNILLNEDVLTVKEDNHKFSISCDVVVVSMREFYSMLDIIQEVLGGTRVNIKKR